MNEISWHLIKLDIHNAFQRACRPHQEKTVDSFEDGRLKYEWDILKENYFLRHDHAIVNICRNCPLNLTSDYEGCQNKMPNLTLLKLLINENFKESLLLKRGLLNDNLDYWETREFLEEKEKIDKILQRTTWPVAQVVYQDPILNQEKDLIVYPWDGTDEEKVPYGNEGYRFGVTKTGIIIRKNLTNILPQKFTRLWWREHQLFGITLEEEIIVFEPFGGFLPTWGGEDDYKSSELLFVSLPSEIFFKETARIFFDYLLLAQKNGTGVNISFLE